MSHTAARDLFSKPALKAKYKCSSPNDPQNSLKLCVKMPALETGVLLLSPGWEHTSNCFLGLESDKEVSLGLSEPVEWKIDIFKYRKVTPFVWSCWKWKLSRCLCPISFLKIYLAVLAFSGSRQDFFFLSVLVVACILFSCNMWGPSFLTRAWTQVPWIGSVES